LVCERRQSASAHLYARHLKRPDSDGCHTHFLAAGLLARFREFSPQRLERPSLRPDASRALLGLGDAQAGSVWILAAVQENRDTNRWHYS